MKRLFIAWLLLTTALFGAWQIASAQMLMPIVNFGPPRASSNATLTVEGSATESSGGTTITYSGVNFGTAASNRVIAAAFFVRSNNGYAAASATIGGVSATHVTNSLAQSNSGGAGGVTTDIFYASVPTGTSGNVVLTFTGSSSIRTAVQLYSVLTSTPVPSAGNNTASGSTVTLTQSISVPTNGVGFSAYGDINTGTVTWTNATQDNSINLSGGNTFAVAHTGIGSISVTAAGATGSTNAAMSLASWGP